MELTFQLMLLLIGLTLLWKMGELAVRNALGFSRIYGIHQFTVGFVIFAISTGLPEISSAIVSSLNKVPELSVGDLMGSTLVNMTLVLGILGVIVPTIDVSGPLRKKLLKTSILILLIFVWFAFQRKGSVYMGFLLIVVYLFSLYWFQVGLPKADVSEEVREIEEEVSEEEKKARLSPKVSILLKLAGSLGLLLVASWITVHAGTTLSISMGIDISLLGGTVIAVGTSLPELVLEVHAIRKKEYSLALGDLFGSSLLNISLILGVLALMNPNLNLSYVMKVLPFAIVTLVYVMQLLLRKKSFTRIDGAIFLLIFLSYMGWSIFSVVGR